MAGKNHVEKGFRILFNDGSARDLSGDLIPGTISGMGIDWDNVDLTGVSESVRHGLAGHGTAIITFQMHMNDTATTGGYTVIQGKDGATGALELQFGQAGAAPTGTDPELYFTLVYPTFTVSFDGGRAVMNVTMRNASPTAPVWQNFGS
jgi:hypothetical protein